MLYIEHFISVMNEFEGELICPIELFFMLKLHNNANIFGFIGQKLLQKNDSDQKNFEKVFCVFFVILKLNKNNANDIVAEFEA
jgi:hypothetical protein